MAKPEPVEKEGGARFSRGRRREKRVKAFVGSGGGPWVGKK